MDVLIVSENKVFREELQKYFEYWNSLFKHTRIFYIEVSETFPSREIVYPLTISDVYPPPSNVDYYVLVIYSNISKKHYHKR